MKLKKSCRGCPGCLPINIRVLLNGEEVTRAVFVDEQDGVLLELVTDEAGRITNRPDGLGPAYRVRYGYVEVIPR